MKRPKPRTIAEALFGQIPVAIPWPKAPERPLMSCGHRADTITHDTLAPLCSICMNVEEAVA